ncbi:type II secretion system F family protein [Kitasatospora sp. NPDC004240]
MTASPSPDWPALGLVVAAAVLLVRRWAARLRSRRRAGVRMRRVLAGPENGGRPSPASGLRRKRACDPPGGRRSDGRVRRLAVATVAGVVLAALADGGAGLLAGVLLGCGMYRWLPRERSPAERRAALESDRLAGQFPLTAELLAACLGSAGSPAEAVAAVGRSVGAPMGPRLAAISAELALGAPPEVCWSRLGEDRPVLAPLARCLVRTSLSGAPAAGQLTALAQGRRAAAIHAAHARVRRAGVLATAPLGLCFLPAFVLISVVPVVLGLTTSFGARL